MDSEPKPQTRCVPLLDEFPHQATDTIRFSDMDPQGHVNNAVIATYFESGRGAMFRGSDLGVGVCGATFVLVHTEISFHRQLRWPGTVVIGTALARLGRTSFTLAQSAFKDGACFATGTATMVLIDKVNGKPLPLPDTITKRLSQWSRQGNSTHR
jgi:acyl-CoA thioester hydrolase